MLQVAALMHDGPSSLMDCFALIDHCWSNRLEGKYISEQHGASNECYDFATAKEKCAKAGDCHGIATQSNVCGGKYRVTHGTTASLRHYGNWAAYNLWAYTLDRGCAKDAGNSCPKPESHQSPVHQTSCSRSTLLCSLPLVTAMSIGHFLFSS